MTYRNIGPASGVEFFDRLKKWFAEDEGVLILDDAQRAKNLKISNKFKERGKRKKEEEKKDASVVRAFRVLRARSRRILSFVVRAYQCRCRILLSHGIIKARSKITQKRTPRWSS